MARQWIKKELKKDFLTGFIVSIKEFVVKRKQTSLSLLAVVAVAGVFSFLLIYTQNKNINRAYSTLIRAESTMFSDPNLALSLCDRVISEAGAPSKLGSLASFLKGEALFVKEDYEGAIKIYRQAKEHIRSEFVPNIVFSVAKCQESMGNFKEALETYRQFISDYDRHYLSADAYISSARIMMAAGQIEPASRQLEIVKSRFQGTQWAAYAEKLQSGLKK
ncbi:MAG: tetratricopeptide repeat protein [bacterium]